MCCVWQVKFSPEVKMCCVWQVKISPSPPPNLAPQPPTTLRWPCDGSEGPQRGLCLRLERLGQVGQVGRVDALGQPDGRNSLRGRPRGKARWHCVSVDSGIRSLRVSTSLLETAREAGHDERCVGNTCDDAQTQCMQTQCRQCSCCVSMLRPCVALNCPTATQCTAAQLPMPQCTAPQLLMPTALHHCCTCTSALPHCCPCPTAAHHS